MHDTWYISNMDHKKRFYSVKSSGSEPPEKGWKTCHSGIEPAPILTVCIKIFDVKYCVVTHRSNVGI